MNVPMLSDENYLSDERCDAIRRKLPIRRTLRRYPTKIAIWRTLRWNERAKPTVVAAENRVTIWLLTCTHCTALERIWCTQSMHACTSTQESHPTIRRQYTLAIYTVTQNRNEPFAFPNPFTYLWNKLRAWQ